MKLAEIPLEKLSPGMRQYAELKSQYPGCILFYRLGDFYEAFFEDAELVSKELELTLTGRECGLEERAPMCGVPYHSVDAYLKRLVDKGYKIAVCDQLSDPATSKGLVERDVVRVVTPGTVIESDLLQDENHNYTACYYDNGEKGAAFVLADVSTGKLAVSALPRTMQKRTEEVISLLSRFAPRELLLNAKAMGRKSVMEFVKMRLNCTVTPLEDEDFTAEAGTQRLCAQFQAASVEMLGLSSVEEQYALVGTTGYIAMTKKSTVNPFRTIESLDATDALGLDLATRRNLELTETMRRGEKRGSLFGVLDHTCTAMGKRMLKSWIESPLTRPIEIMARLDAVEAFTKHTAVLLEVRDCLDGVYDLERLMTRVLYETASPRDLIALSATAKRLPPLKEQLHQIEDGSKLLHSFNTQISTLDAARDLIERAIVEEPPATLKDGGVIRDGFSEELDTQRGYLNGGQASLNALLERERQRTGIKTLKIGYNRMYGYYLEVTPSYYSMIPDDYIRKQSLTNSQRFITQELKTLEDRISGAKDRSLQLETALFEKVRKDLAAMLSSVQETATAVASVDVLASFAHVALEYNYVKPEIAVDGSIQITDGRHPVVEQMQTDEPFVPNDTYMNSTSVRMILLTGPNMSGKSTYMRQVALITLMAQMGSFVPASYARISVVDQIFTRIGASDDLAAGESTFMVEMKEVSHILQHATKNSLVILDEVGRGTSTYDGVSIARSVAEYILKRKKGCKTLFATHYHELLDLEEQQEGVKNCSVAVKKSGDSIRFLHKIVDGGTDDSYGIAVAKLAGLPDWVVERSKTHLREMEARDAKPALKQEETQLNLAAAQEERVLDTLRKTHVPELTDAECREVLTALTELLS